MFTMHRRLWIAILSCLAIAITLLFWSHQSKPRRDVSAAEDGVYEAVVRDMVTQTSSQANVRQLVFDDTVLTELEAGASIETCEQTARKRLRLENSKPLYDSLADKAYRFFAGSAWNGSLRADTIQDFLQKSCTVGRLSQTFHTELRRTFIAAQSVHFEGWPVEKDGSKSFQQLFPGSGGIISFSQVGFDSTLDEAIVATSFVCEGLCGSGYRYILKKKSGRWQIANKLLIWVS